MIIRQLKYKSWVKLVAVAAYTSLLPFGLLMGVFALFGFNTVHFNGENLVGFTGLVSGIGIGIFFATFLTGFAATFGYAGLILYSRYRNLSIECELENEDA